MAGHRGRGRRGGGHAAEHADERWLLTYADMITLLMALFMVLFSISSVNTSKFESLQRALQDAFSGRILPGGKSVQQTGGSDKTEQSLPTPPIPAITTSGMESSDSKDGQDKLKEDEDFRRLKAQIDQYAREHHLQRQIHTVVAQRGLVIRVLTDDILFDSGQARLKPEASPLLARISRLVAYEGRHPVAVEGHTDSRPIATSQFPSNWELSAARASSIVRFMAGHGVYERRLQAVGHAALRPLQSNSTTRGQTRNRRVEIVLLRINTGIFKTKESI